MGDDTGRYVKTLQNCTLSAEVYKKDQSGSQPGPQRQGPEQGPEVRAWAWGQRTTASASGTSGSHLVMLRIVRRAREERSGVVLSGLMR